MECAATLASVGGMGCPLDGRLFHGLREFAGHIQRVKLRRRRHTAEVG